MRMLNRAIEDAADASEFIKNLQEPGEKIEELAPKKVGESRVQYRARMRALEKAAKKSMKEPS